MMKRVALLARDRSSTSRHRLLFVGVRTAFAMAALLATGGCIATLPAERFAAEEPQMRPEVFFAGATHSFGVLETRSGAPAKIFHVDGHGAAQADGTFRLDQTVTFDGQPPQRRTWLMRPTGPHAYRARLTDASGEVIGEAYGALFHLHYPYRSLARMEQWLYLQPDGRTVLNEATMTVAGVVVARLSERISRDEATMQGSR